MLRREEQTYLELSVNLLTAKAKVKTNIPSNRKSAGYLNARVKHFKGLMKRFIINNLKWATTTCYPLNKERTESLTPVRAPSSKIGD